MPTVCAIAGKAAVMPKIVAATTTTSSLAPILMMPIPRFVAAGVPKFLLHGMRLHRKLRH
jgi:hypothetical protein